MEQIMKMLPYHYEAFKKCLNSNTAAEQGCFALCSDSRGNQRLSLLIKEIVPLSADDFEVQEEMSLSVKPSAMLRVARMAQKQNLSICMIHTHPMCDGYVDFSVADDIGNLRTFPFFHGMVPELHHSCLVWDKSLKNVSARIYDANNSWMKLDRVEVIGSPEAIENVDQDGNTKLNSPDDTYHRQGLLLGETGQNIVRKRRIGVVGHGGLGACVSLIILHTGYRFITGVDFDIVEKHSLPRIPSATLGDVDEQFLKVLISQRYAENYEADIEFISLPCPVENPDIAPDLKDCDALIATTDNTRSRAFLNQFSQQNYIPLLDLGVQFVANSKGEIVKDIGKVNLILPGTACLQCSMHIDPERLRAESLPKDHYERELNEGYVRGLDIKQPSMMMFNMEIAARGVQCLTGYFTGLIKTRSNLYERFSFLGCNGQQHHKFVKKYSDPGCPFCSHGGLYLGAGDSLPMLITPLDSEGVKQHA
jgi:molybdopterin/thiamine biosynthesis adenylyltransferase